MVKYKASSLLREQAKIKLDGKFSAAIRILLLGQMIIMFVNYGVSDFLSILHLDEGFMGYLLSLAFSFLLSILLGVFEIGYAYFYLNAYCGEPYHTSDLIYGFQNKPSVSVALTAIFSVTNFLATEPARVLLSLGIQTSESRLIVYAILVEVLALILAVYVWLRFHLALYLYLDFPDKSFGELLQLSSGLMKGHKKRLFCLRLSFLPMYLLGLCTCGIGFLWITPYVSMTDVCFFMDLMNPEEVTTP